MTDAEIIAHVELCLALGLPELRAAKVPELLEIARRIVGETPAVAVEYPEDPYVP